MHHYNFTNKCVLMFDMYSYIVIVSYSLLEKCLYEMIQYYFKLLNWIKRI